MNTIWSGAIKETQLMYTNCHVLKYFIQMESIMNNFTSYVLLQGSNSVLLQTLKIFRSLVAMGNGF